MATTRLISMHLNKGKTIAQCLRARTDYAKNPEKTDNGELVSSFACDPKTVDAEFLYAKRQYRAITGREQKSNVIAYQIRQSFKPGEITPEDANRVGCELAQRFLKGKHAYIVATHVDKSHTHNHIIWNSTTLDCRGKFRDFLGSGKAVARLSDMICLEHQLSIIENPKRGNHSYNKWLGSKAKPSHRERLRVAMDDALAQKPKDFEAFLSLMQSAGYTVERGKHTAFRAEGQKQNIRLRSMGEGYTEDALRAVIAGEKAHTPRKRYMAAVEKNSLLIDIEAKMRAGKGAGYQHWAKKFNLKQMAQTVSYLSERGLLSEAALAAKTREAKERFYQFGKEIKSAEKRMAEIAVLKKHIINYANTREVYAGYRKAGYSKKYLAEHEGDIILHKAAKKAFDGLGMKKLPTVRSLNDEYARLLAAKKDAYPKYRAARDEMREMLIHKANVEQILETPKEKKRDMER